MLNSLILLLQESMLELQLNYMEAFKEGSELQG